MQDCCVNLEHWADFYCLPFSIYINHIYISTHIYLIYKSIGTTLGDSWTPGLQAAHPEQHRSPVH